MVNRPFVIPISTPRPSGADEPRTNKAELHSIDGLRPKLFYERYGVLENPFGVTPNPRYLYQSKTHAEARLSLVTGIECGVGFQALIAPPGMGKTSILFDLLERFNKVALTAFLFHNHGNSRDLLRYLVSELGGEAHDSNPVSMQETIVELLIRERRAGRQTIIIIDEAQNLNATVLETVRLLSNFETAAEKLVQIVLAGQPQLAQRLTSPELAQLHQRISMLTTLIPFGLEDTRNYIEHRLMIAGYKGPPLFTSAAVTLIWERSGGVPREINTLCFNALLSAGAVEHKQVDSDILHDVVERLDLDRIRLTPGKPSSGMGDVRTTNGLPLGNTAEDPPATSIDKTCKATVSGAADDAFARPTAFDEVDLVQLGKIAAGIVSTSYGEKAEHSAVSGTNTEAGDASARPTGFDGVDVVGISMSSKEKVEQAAVLGAKTKADEASTQPSASEVDLFQLGEKASKRDSTNPEKENDQAAVSGAGTESYDIVGGSILPDGLTWARNRKTDLAIFAPTGITDAASREREVAGSSTDDLQAMIENLAAKMEGALKEKRDLSSGVQSALTVPEPGSGVESTPEVEPGVAAEGALRSILAEKDAVFETDQQSLWKAATKLSRWPKQQWEMHRSKIYLGTSVLIFLLVLTLPQRSPETNLTMFKELSLNLGLAATPSMPVPDDHPDVGVWVDLHTGLYYCSGTEAYGKTGGGKFTTQRQAREEHFKPAASNVCQ